ncbi:Cap15 family cyclic dinucleotide receptor domain-containing protein [Pseudomonas sp. S2_E01]
MQNLTLSSDELSSLKKIFGTLTVLLFLIFATINTSPQELPDATQCFRWISSSITITSVLFFLFYKLVWKFWKIPKWLGRPVLEGTWIGELSSNYKIDERNQALVLPIVFIVKQSYLTLSIRSLTEHQVGESKVEAILENKKTGIFRLAYVYELQNEYQGRTTLINGAGDLQLSNLNLKLSGSYWTSSPTNGVIRLRKIASKIEIQSFKDAKSLWPNKSDWKGY